MQADYDVDITIGEGLAGGAVGAFLTTLIVGAILVAVAPAYTERMTGTVLDDLVGSFAYGLFFVLAIVVMTVSLVITGIGIVLAIPLVLVAYLVWAVGSAIAYLAIAERLVGRGDDWLKPLVVGAAMNGGLMLTGVGSIVAFLVGATGFGAVLHDRYG